MKKQVPKFPGIWKSREIRSHFKGDLYVSNNEGETPTEILKDRENTLHLKREDKNPSGSWKDRGTAYKISELKQKNVSDIVISSSGNAAISLLSYANNLSGVRVHVVVKESILEHKKFLLEKLAGKKHTIYFARDPKRLASRLVAEKGYFLLRSSTDSVVVKGYWSLGIELFKIIKNSPNDYVIICAVSSGATLVGLVQGIQLRLAHDSQMPKIVVVQTQKCHPIVNMHYNMYLQEEKTSLSDAIANKSILRSPQILKIIQETQGEAFSITDSELIKAESFINGRGYYDISYTSLLSIAGYLRLRTNDYSKFICILSGR